MFYLEYENDTKLVVEIHEKYPEIVRENCSIAKSNQFDLGMELEYVITVDTVDQDGNVTASSITKQTTPAYQLLKRIEDKNKVIDSLQDQVNALNIAMAQILGV